MRNFIAIITLFFLFVSKGQVVITNELNTDITINSEALLEIRSASKNKGLLLPKVVLVSTNNSSPFSSHEPGLIVYNTNKNILPSGLGVTPGFYYNDGSSWNRVQVQTPTIGDIKYSSQSANHDGWFLLNGQSIAGQSLAIRTAAVNLGFVGNLLPNTANVFLKSKNSTEALRTLSGNNSVTLSQSNLPNISYTGIATASSGTHSHTFNDRAFGSLNSNEPGTTAPIVDDGTSGSLTTSLSVDHNHTFTVSTRGSGTAIDLTPKYLSANIFVYLGQ